MSPQIALLLCILFILYLFIMDSKRAPNVSRALWIPLIWMLIVGSKPVIQWLDPGSAGVSEADLQAGSLIDRTVLSVLIVAGIFILIRKKIDWSQILRRNIWIFLFFSYAGLSVLWSDFPEVSFRRWIRTVGNLIMVLVVVTEPDPLETMKALIKRCAYVLVPLSVLFIKYYRHLGVGYNSWTGAEFVQGVTTDKNALGRLCVVCGFVSVFNVVTTLRKKNLLANKSELIVQIFMIFLICWLLIVAKSATSLGTLLIGICIFVGLGLTVIRRNIRHINIILVLALVTFLILEPLLNITESFVKNLGRDMTFTDRVFLWKDLINMGTDPLFGAGFSSFWLGDRLLKLWNENWQGFTEAHNGYLETYLDLGLTGLFFLVGIVASTYSKIRSKLISNFDCGRFQMSFLVMILVYNFTESAFRESSLMWYIFLLIATDYLQRPQLKVLGETGL